MLKKNVQLDGSSILVTGAAGFIGASLTRRLLDEYPDCRVIGIDNITDYYGSNDSGHTGTACVLPGLYRGQERG